MFSRRLVLATVAVALLWPASVFAADVKLGATFFKTGDSKTATGSVSVPKTPPGRAYWIYVEATGDANTSVTMKVDGVDKGSVSLVKGKTKDRAWARVTGTRATRYKVELIGEAGDVAGRGPWTISASATLEEKTENWRPEKP